MPQDYSSQNLRGRSFRGQNLEGANFSDADIRGADFTSAILIGANFCHAKAGLQNSWVIFLLVISWLLSGLSGFSSAVSGLLVSYIFSHYSEYQIVGLVAIITQIIFFVVTIRSGIQTGFGTVTVVGSVAGAIVGAIIVAKVFAGAFAFAIGIAFAGAVTFALTFAFAFAVADAHVFAVTFVFAIGVSIGVSVIKTFAVVSTVAFAIAVACANACALALFGVYIGLQAIKGDEKHTLVRNIAVTCATYGGTSFRDADLTNADFTQATLKNTDFTGATLTRSCWQQVKKLDLVRPGKTYLKNALVRLGQPNQINGKHYNLQLAGETLKLTRKTGEQIASIPLVSSVAASFQGFTPEDWERFDKLQAMFESRDLQQSQQPHHSSC